MARIGRDGGPAPRNRFGRRGFGGRPAVSGSTGGDPILDEYRRRKAQEPGPDIPAKGGPAPHEPLTSVPQESKPIDETPIDAVPKPGPTTPPQNRDALPPLPAPGTSPGADMERMRRLQQGIMVNKNPVTTEGPAPSGFLAAAQRLAGGGSPAGPSVENPAPTASGLRSDSPGAGKPIGSGSQQVTTGVRGAGLQSQPLSGMSVSRGGGGVGSDRPPATGIAAPAPPPNPAAAPPPATSAAPAPEAQTSKFNQMAQRRRGPAGGGSPRDRRFNLMF